MCAPRIMIFEGTQPTLTQVPPSVPASIIVTDAPSSAARSAPANAAPPLPMTATCNLSPPPLRGPKKSLAALRMERPAP